MPRPKKSLNPSPAPPDPVKEIVKEMKALRKKIKAVKGIDEYAYKNHLKRYYWLLNERDRLTNG